jgi:hypothetical protein
MGEPLTLTLPMPPNMANGRGHWRKKHKAQQAYRSACVARLYGGTLPALPDVPPTPVTITSTLYLWATMDDDNALARIKHAADFLKWAGYIVDDRRQHCRFTIPEQVIDRKNQRLVLTISPLSPSPRGVLAAEG